MSFDKLLNEFDAFRQSRRLEKSLSGTSLEAAEPVTTGFDLVAYHDDRRRSTEAFSKCLSDLKRSTQSLKANLAQMQQDELLESAPARLAKFSASLRKATLAGELTLEQVSYLETRRNHMAQQFADAGLI